MSDTNDASTAIENAPASETTEAKPEVAPATTTTDTEPESTSTKPEESTSANGNHEAQPAKPKQAAARTPKSSAKGKTEEDGNTEYSPGDSVQVKIQGYPWWPAVVVTEDHFPAAARAARPQTKPRKDGSTAPIYAVQFLGSPEYYWSGPKDIKPLPIEDIKAFIDSGKKSSTKGLKAAYTHAAMQPSLEQLMKAKTELESQLANGEVEDEEMPDAEDSEDIELDDNGEPVKPRKSNKKKAASAGPKKTPSKTPSKKRKTDSTDGPSAKKSKATAAATAEESPETTHKISHEQKVKNVMFLRHKLQKCLLGKEEPDAAFLEEMPAYLDKLDAVEANVELFRETKIGKVLLRIHKLENVPRDDELHIKEHVAKLLEKWQEVMDLQKKRDEDDSKAGTPAKTESKADVETTAKDVEKSAGKTDEKEEAKVDEGQAEESKEQPASEPAERVETDGSKDIAPVQESAAEKSAEEPVAASAEETTASA